MSYPALTSPQGHRARLLERFGRAGIESFHDYEILELLLAYAIPRRDTKSIAKELLARFNTVTRALNAAPEELERVPGIGRRAALLLRLVREIGAWCLRENFTRQSVIAHRGDVEAYLRFHFGGRRDEFVAALFLDTGNHVLETSVIGEGTVNQCTIYPRAILEKAMRAGAASLIIAHNHPGGATEPSDADWQITNRLFSVCRLLDIPLLDHILIVQDRVVSLRDLPRWPTK
jgi:DNA repair protein RadC